LNQALEKLFRSVAAVYNRRDFDENKQLNGGHRPPLQILEKETSIYIFTFWWEKVPA